MKARLLGGIAAILLAIMGTVLLINYVSGADSRAMAGTDTQEVLIVSMDIAAGTEVSSFGDSVQSKQIPSALVVEGALTNLTDVQDKVAAMALLPGDQLSVARLSDTATYKGTNPVKVPDTMQQLSFAVPADRVVGGQIQPGDYIALILSYNNGMEPGTGEIPASKMTLRKALVVSMQASGQSQAAAPGTSSEPATSAAPNTVGADSWVVTVALAAEDSIKLVHAAEFGHIWVAKEATTPDTTPAPLLKGDVFK